MANTYTSLTYHIVFSTKYRHRLIRDEFAPELHKYIAGIIRENKSQPIEINGVEDHIHILTGISPTIAVSDMVRLIKSNSSKWFNEHFQSRHKFGWQIGYAGFTVYDTRGSRPWLFHFAATRLVADHRISMAAGLDTRSD